MSTDKLKPPAVWKKAASTTLVTTNRKANDQQEESASSARIPLSNSATTRNRSPRKMKTQIAKLVYNPSTTKTKSNQYVDVNKNEQSVVATELKEFQKKRQDRDREVKEIQEMLNEIKKTPPKETQLEPQKAVVTNKSPTKVIATNTFQRSKTDTNLRRPTARKSQTRQESHSARSKSVHNEVINSPPKRQKAYNAEEAQRYMQDQKKKRKSLQTTLQGSDSKAAIDRDEIKKRLENLRQNTRKIVSKNVNIAKKKAGAIEDKPLPRREEHKNGIAKEQEIPSKPKVREAWSERLLKIPTQTRNEKSNEVIKKADSPPKPTILEPWADKVVTLKTPPEKQQNSSPLSVNHKKIGLLRKPEFKDHSFSAIKDINMDKENLIIDILTPQISGHPTSRFREMAKEQENPTPLISEYPSLKFMEDPKEDKTNISPLELRSERTAKSLKRKSSPELDLKVPEAKLRTRTSMREKSIQVNPSVEGSSKIKQKTTELPYWLKPTSVQAYPYNFIMAVRKKLEAIANPPAVASSSSSSIQPKPAKKMTTETPLSYPKTNRSNNVKRRIMDNGDKSLSKSIEKSYSNKENINEPRLSRSFSEVTSNFSSISIQLPDSQNTISSPKVKPLPEGKKTLKFDEDDTTVSSSIFSSPEKKNFNGRSKNSQAEALSPLSMDNISNMHIRSKSMVSNITVGRGDSFVETTFDGRLDNRTLSHRSDKSVDFSQLLDDFNRSLSQVIEVNQQLKTTLVKSQIFSPERKKEAVSTTTNQIQLPEYVSDFEESSKADEEEQERKESNKTVTISSVAESQTSTKPSSEINTEKSFSASSSNEEVPEEDNQSQGSSPQSVETQTFIVTSEDQEQNSVKSETIHEEALIESPVKENMSGNQYSLDSLETSPQDYYIKSHINTSRGEYKAERSELSAGPPPSYKISSESQVRTPTNFMNSSMDSEFVRVFNKSDMEISMLSLNQSLSESVVNYSSIGMYEKLIQNETNKSEHLASLLKMREKALIDRTKGQIAWLEVQKERYKAKGLVLQISAVKKKQRGILLKMEKEREEIKKLLQQAKVQRDDHKLRIPEIRPSSDVTLLQQRRTGIQTSSSAASQQKQRHSSYQQYSSTRSKSSSTIVKGYELETSRSLEQLLQKREEDLRRRREHVERLMEWHRRLDQEEAEVLQLEKILLDYNNVHVQQQLQDENVVVEDRTPNQTKMAKKLKEIDRSLRELSSISGADGSTDGAGGGAGEFARTTGSKLNKLWRRLTSQRIEKFQPNKRYKLCKADVEQLYEEAKLAVLHDFGNNADHMEVFLGQSSIVSTPQPSSLSTEIPKLNLNFGSGQSEDDAMDGNYNPSTIEEDFVAPSVSSRECLSDVDSENGSKKKLVSRKRMTENDSNTSSNAKAAQKFSGQKRLQDDQSNSVSHIGRLIKTNSLPENVEYMATDFEMTTENHTKGDIESKTSMNHVVTSRIGIDVGVSASNSFPKDNSDVLEGSLQQESLQKEVSSSKMINDPIENSESRSDSIDTRIKPNVLLLSGGAKHETESSKISSDVKNSYIKSSKSNTIEGIEKLTNTIHELASSSSSRSSIPTSRSKETFNNQNHWSEISRESIAELTACTNTKSDSKNSKIASQIETIAPGCSGSTSLSSKIYSAESLYSATENAQTSIEESILANKISERINGSINSSIKSSSKTSMSFGGSSDSVPITDAKQSENLSYKKNETESLISNKNNHTVETSSTYSNFVTENTPSPGFGAKIDAIKSQSESKTFIETKSDSQAILNKIIPAISSPKSSEESASVSILKSLLNSSYNSNSAFISDHASKTASEIQAHLSTNGLMLGTVPKSPIQSNEKSPSSKDEQSIVNSLSFPDEATLNSIKSIDNSTNSKHSTNTATASTKNAHSAPTTCSQDSKSESIPQSYSSAFEDTISSNQIRSSVIMSTTSPTSLIQAPSEPLVNAFYESDFTGDGDETNLDDLSLPKFETTAEEDQFNESQSSPATNKTDFEKRLIDLDVSLKDLDATFEKALSPEKTPSPPRDDGSRKSQQQNDSALMPDIISEVELRRRHQAMLENELKQFEHAVPYMYVREIPNKPPPPYVPPAHGSPMTTIFPSEERIKDITFRRTKELYNEILNIDSKDENGKKLPSVLDENITNIYERIILDICKEYLTDYKPILASADPNNFHSPLAFFNPPDRLRCMQDFIYKEVRKSLAMDKNVPKRNQVYSVYGHRGKRDHVGEIIIQEMYEEDDVWSNFYAEEEEVLELIIDEIVGITVREIVTEVLEEEIPRESTTSTVEANKSVEMRCNNST